jgi:hypothetical protein
MPHKNVRSEHLQDLEGWRIHTQTDRLVPDCANWCEKPHEIRRMTHPQTDRDRDFVMQGKKFALDYVNWHEKAHKNVRWKVNAEREREREIACATWLKVTHYCAGWRIYSQYSRRMFKMLGKIKQKRPWSYRLLHSGPHTHALTRRHINKQHERIYIHAYT